MVLDKDKTCNSTNKPKHLSTWYTIYEWTCIIISYVPFILSPINILISCRYYPNQNCINDFYSKFISRHFHKSSKRDDKSRNPSDRNIPDSHIASPSSPLSSSSAKKRKERERESTNWRRCAVNVLNDGILITRHVMGAIKQLAAVSISPMHQETSARRDEFAYRDATFVETIYRGGHRLANFPR